MFLYGQGIFPGILNAKFRTAIAVLTRAAISQLYIGLCQKK